MNEDRYEWIMSPQAHRRLVSTVTAKERYDLACEIARNLGFDYTRGDCVRIIEVTFTMEGRVLG